MSVKNAGVATSIATAVHWLPLTFTMWALTIRKWTSKMISQESEFQKNSNQTGTNQDTTFVDYRPIIRNNPVFRDVLFDPSTKDSSDTDLTTNLLLYKVPHFFPNVNFLKYTQLISSQTKLIKEVWQHEFRWIVLPKNWYKALLKKKLTTASCYLVASELYKLLKANDGKCDISKNVFNKHTSRYKAVIDTLINDSYLKSREEQLKKICNHCDGKIEGYESKCITYACNLNSKIKWVAVKVDKQELSKKVLKVSETPFAKWQHKEFENVSFDFLRALEALSPVRGNAEHYQLIAHFKCLSDGRHYCVSSRHGRIFHLVSNLKKEYRKYILIDGETTVNIDLRASQPAFMGYMLLKEDAPQSQMFAEVLEKYRLYDYLSLKYLKKASTKGYKKSFLTWLYSKDYLYQRLEIHEHIRSEWPWLHKWIIDFKENNGHAKLAHMMQHKESEWVFKVAQILGSTTLTIHDSFLVKKSEANRVCEFVNSIIKKDGIPTFAVIEKD